MNHTLKTIIVLFTGALVAPAQNDPIVLFAHVDFVKPATGKSADYHQALQTLIVPKFQKAVDAGQAYAFVNFSRRFPHGSELAASEVRFALGRTLKSVSTGVTIDAGMPPGLFTTAMGEMWTLSFSTDLTKFLQAKHYRVLFLKALPGKTTMDIVNIYKAPETAATTANGVVIFNRTYRGPDDDFTTIVMHAYTDLDELPMPGVVNTGQTSLALERLRNVRSTIRTELWDRRNEFVGPKP